MCLYLFHTSVIKTWQNEGLISTHRVNRCHKCGAKQLTILGRLISSHLETFGDLWLCRTIKRKQLRVGRKRTFYTSFIRLLLKWPLPSLCVATLAAYVPQQEHGQQVGTFREGHQVWQFLQANTLHSSASCARQNCLYNSLPALLCCTPLCSYIVAGSWITMNFKWPNKRNIFHCYCYWKPCPLHQSSSIYIQCKHFVHHLVYSCVHIWRTF